MSYYIMRALTLSDSLGKLINYRLGPTFKFRIRAELHANSLNADITWFSHITVFIIHI